MMMGSNARLFVIFASLSLILAISGQALAADVRSLPIGHLKVTVGENGKINVEARCVPTKDIINEIARQTGRTVVYDCDVQTYASIYRPDSWSDAVWWASNINVSPGARIEEEGNIWHVKAEISPNYDPALTEADVIESCTTSVPPMVSAKGTDETLDTGILVYKGHYIPGPYFLGTETPDDYHSNVTINGLVVASFDRTPPEPKPEQPLPALPESGQFEDKNSLSRYLSYVLLPQLVDKYGPETAKEKIRDFLKTQRIVSRILSDEVSIYDPVIVITYIDKPDIPADPIIGPMDINTGRPLKDNMSVNITAKEMAQTQLDFYRQNLGEPEVLMIQENGVQGGVASYMNLKWLLDAVVSGSGLSILQSECLLNELFGGDRTYARAMAVNIRENSEAFIDKLQALCTELEKKQIEAGIAPMPSAPDIATQGQE